MMNDLLIERLGQLRLQEELRLADQHRLVREAENRPLTSVWSMIARALAEGAAAGDTGRRIPPDATRAGEMPGL